MSSLHAQKTLVKTEPRAITKADSVSMPPSLAAAVPDAFSRGKSAREHGSGVYISDTTVAFPNGMRYFIAIAWEATHCQRSFRSTQASVQRKLRLNSRPSFDLPSSVEMPVATANCPPKTRTSTLLFLADL